MQDFEKLGAFYLGRRRDLQHDSTTNEAVLYDAKDLTTHAVCVGMTGSGKTGLCISLLEEAAIDRVPVIAIDPKGDLGNLLLTFPNLSSADFAPWVDPAQAMRHGQTPAEFATATAKLWKNGLANWGQSGERIRRLKDSADFRIYTPGSSAGMPLSVLQSFSVPPAAVLDDSDAFRDKVSGAAAGLLALLSIDADPITSREHILLSNVLEKNWREGKSLTLPDLIRSIQEPPFERVGILDLESFFPQKDRLRFSLMINNLLASPSFAGWMTGEPLDIQRLLYDDAGKPSISILSIAHLNDAERMFFVTMVLNEVLSWMRGQPGTSSLRAILYMDEVFGYFPPTANPPSKQPMLTLLKQARAFGLGVVLATQNPVDLDYKGLSNTGTWFLGRLQTERDKQRVLEGLEGVSGGHGQTFDRQAMERVLAGLGSRVFLMHNVHEDKPVVFETRWAMSYLRGPLTRDQIKMLMDERRPVEATIVEGESEKVSASDHSTSAIAQEEEDVRGTIPPEIPQLFAPVLPRSVENRRIVYRPRLLGIAEVHFKRATYGLDAWTKHAFIAAEIKNNSVWRSSEPWEGSLPTWQQEPQQPCAFESPTRPLLQPRQYSSWATQLKLHAYQTCRKTIWSCKQLKAHSDGQETEGDFRARLGQLAKERRDLEVEKLQEQYSKKLATLSSRLEKAEQRLAKEKEQFHSKTFDSFVSIGQTFLGAVLGRKLASRTNVSRASTSMRSVGRAAKERGDIGRAKEDVDSLQQELQKLEQEFKQKVEGISEALDPMQLVLKENSIAPTKSDTQVVTVALLWMPWWVSDAGVAEPAWKSPAMKESA